MSRRLLTLGLPLLALGLLAAGCGRRETPAEAGIRTQTLLVGNAAEPGDLDPQTAAVLNDQIIQIALGEGLTALDEQSTVPVPAAAERWEVSADGLTWTFHLRAGLRWSNGEPLTAGDFLASWRRILNPRFASEGAWYFFPVRDAEAYSAGRIADPATVGLAAPDDRTVVVTLARPTPFLPALASLPAWFPINPRVVAAFDGLERRGSAWTRPGNHVGNGPFRLKEWTPNARIVVEKNPYHWEAASNRLREIVFFPIENPDVEERNFRAGQLHVTFNLPVSRIASWREQHAARLRLDPQQQANFLRFNVTHPALADARVRRALSQAIDRDTLSRTVLQGSRPPAHALTPPGTGGYTARAAVGVDFAAARQLLADAGYPAGRGFPALELQCRTDELSPRLAEALQASWQRELGIRILITPVEQKTWVQNQQSLNYAVTLAAWTADYPDPLTYLGLFASDSSYNWTGWKNPGYDRLLEEAALTLDPAARYEVFQRAESLLLAEAPVAPVFVGAQTYLIHPAVKGWLPAPLVFRRFQHVSLVAP
ncbi:MAG: peptide ABC transporter substrate-binding protein [Opitutaceae bacterium]|nr:peptide ABC transporter substrate-binding protein [Opitutaceae bacterium]